MGAGTEIFFDNPTHYKAIFQGYMKQAKISFPAKSICKNLLGSHYLNQDSHRNDQLNFQLWTKNFCSKVVTAEKSIGIVTIKRKL